MFYSKKWIRILTPAKINLFLKVLSKRFDGYHELFSLFCAVSLFDSVFLSLSDNREIFVICDDLVVPRGEKNLVYRAIDLFLKDLSLLGFSSNFGVRVVIWKKIPVGSGFGGGSSNAAGVLLLLNEKLGYPFVVEDLISIGRKVGADVPFFIFGRPAIARGIGEELRPFLCRLPRFAVIVYTGSSISTYQVYSVLKINKNLGLTKEEKKIKDAGVIGASLNCKKYLFSDLEVAVRILQSTPFKVKKQLVNLGAIGTLVSGSGSGVFGLFESFREASFAVENLSILEDEWVVSVVTLLS